MKILEINRSLLDITKIKTIEDLNNTDFAKYTNTEHSPWVRYITRLTFISELLRVCALSEEVGTKIQLKHESGRLYYKMRKCKVPKYKLIKLAAEDITRVCEYLEYGTIDIDDILIEITTQANGGI